MLINSRISNYTIIINLCLFFFQIRNFFQKCRRIYLPSRYKPYYFGISISKLIILHFGWEYPKSKWMEMVVRFLLMESDYSGQII